MAASVEAIHERLRTIGSADPDLSTRIVAFDGLSGAGKSTVAGAFAHAVGAPVVPVDHFLLWGDITSWWPRFEVEALAPLAAGRPARFRVRDWTGDPLGSGLLDEPVSVEPAPIVVVEGLTCARGAADPYVTLRVWVEAPVELCLQRGIARDGEVMRDRWVQSLAQQDEFFLEDDTAGRADLVVSGVDGSVIG